MIRFIGNWNRTVGMEDHVFLLGDVALHTPEKTCEILHQLHGTITLVLGNHDHRREMEETNRFDFVSPYIH